MIRQHLRRFPTFLLTVVMLLMMGPAARAGQLVGVSDGVLYDVDRTTGAASNPRDTGLLDLAALAYSPSGQLFGADVFSQDLYTLDLDTGEPELIGTMRGQTSLCDFGCDPTTGLLYASGYGCGQGTCFRALYKIDPDSAERTLIAEELPGGSITFDASGQLYLYNSDVLRVIDKTDGETISGFVVNQRFAYYTGSAVDESGTLFLGTGPPTGPGGLYALDTSTGELDSVGYTGLDGCLYGLAYVPEPATLALIVLGAIPVVVRRRSHKRTP